MPAFIRPAMLALAGFHLALALLGAFAANFADGGDAISRTALTFVFPAAAVVLVVVAAVPRPSRAFAFVAAGVLTLSVAASAAAAAAIVAGSATGQWWMPLLFAIVPAIGVFYALARRNAAALQTA